MGKGFPAWAATVACCLAAAPLAAQNVLEFPTEIRPLAFEMSADESPLFTVQTVSHEQPALLPAEISIGTAPVNPSSGQHNTLASGADDTRERFRQSLADEGLSAVQARDDLTIEALKIARWTGLVLMLGGVAVVVLKQLGVRQLSLPSTSQMKIVDTVRVGRQQGLHLVEIGGDRLVVAADMGGIKSVTLLPGWSAFDNRLEEPLSGQENLRAYELRAKDPTAA